MPSKARIAFRENARDVERLLDLHKDKGGIAQGRRYGLEVLNKSAIVLLTSFWEAYCEDIAAEALEHIVAHAPSSEKLPLELRKLIAKELKDDKHELAVWKLSDNGWRGVLQSRLAVLQADRNRRLNTPKSSQIDDLFRKTLGIQMVSERWRWQKMAATAARAKLDKYVELRGAIAHRGAGATGASVRKSHAVDYFTFLKKLVGRTGGAVYIHVRTVTRVRLWK
jgi:HEPN superfamily RiboL-PSP-like protein